MRSTFGADRSIREIPLVFPSRRQSCIPASLRTRSIWGRIRTTRLASFRLSPVRLTGTPGAPPRSRSYAVSNTRRLDVRNDSPVFDHFSVELKDYRDDLANRARCTYTLPAGGVWTKIEVPLNLASGWTVDGNPDLTRIYSLGFSRRFGPRPARFISTTSPFKRTARASTSPRRRSTTIVERLAHRQFTRLVGRAE